MMVNWAIFSPSTHRLARMKTFAVLRLNDSDKEWRNGGGKKKKKVEGEKKVSLIELWHEISWMKSLYQSHHAVAFYSLLLRPVFHQQLG